MVSAAAFRYTVRFFRPSTGGQFAQYSRGFASMEVKQYMQQLGQQARAASRVLAAADSGAKNRALLAIAEAVDAARQTIADANKKDRPVKRRAWMPHYWTV